MQDVAICLMTTDASDPAPIMAVQSVTTWLAQTEGWIYEQARNLPGGAFRWAVACERTQNTGVFPAPGLYCGGQLPLYRQAWHRGTSFLLRRPPGLGLRLALDAVPASLVHSHFGPRASQDLDLVSRARLPHVVTFYGYDVGLGLGSRMWARRYERLFDAAGAVLCEGPHMAKRLRDLGCPAGKVRVQHLGVRLDEIAFQPRARHPNQPLRVLVAASFREKKGIPDAIRALAIAARQVPIELTVIGDASREKRSQVEKMRILSAAQDSRLPIRWLGYQPRSRLHQEAAVHHLFIHPSVTARDGDTEGGAPVVLTEMAASGIPLVSTRHCDIPNLVRHNVTGFLAEEHDVQALAESVLRVAAGDDLLRIVTAARHRVEQEFDAVRQGVRLGAIYAELAVA